MDVGAAVDEGRREEAAAAEEDRWDEDGVA